MVEPKNIEFSRYVKQLPSAPPKRLECTDEQLIEMAIRADEAPAGFYAVFECADRMHAAKVAHRFKAIFQNYMCVSSGYHVYVLAL